MPYIYSQQKQYLIICNSSPTYRSRGFLAEISLKEEYFQNLRERLKDVLRKKCNDKDENGNPVINFSMVYGEVRYEDPDKNTYVIKKLSWDEDAEHDLRVEGLLIDPETDDIHEYVFREALSKGFGEDEVREHPSCFLTDIDITQQLMEAILEVIDDAIL